MKKRIYSMIICLCITISAFSGVTFAAENEAIVILYENDVHSAVEGYSKLAAMKNELLKSYEHVGVVSSGDYIQGGTLAAISEGRYMIELMNLVDYDAVTLGNHEFDYNMNLLDELVEMTEAPVVSCNFQKVGEDKSFFKPYTIVSYGDTDVAYIGITTPSTITSSSPAQFRNENGEYIYTFNPERLYDVVQKYIDEAKKDGADYIIALSHIGYDESGKLEDVTDLIENTDGFDVVLDGHSHSVIEGMNVKDKGGKEVLLTSTGTKFEHIGKLTITDGEFKTELVKTAEYEKTDDKVNTRLAEINEEYKTLGERKIGKTETVLRANDAEGNRLVRKQNTNLGNLCADAFRIVYDTDVAFVNGGGIRADIDAGDITFNEIYSVFPFNNPMSIARVTGQQIKDMLELNMRTYPEEEGQFPHMSGLIFSVNTSVPSSVKLDENGVFVSVDGEYRVYDIKVLNKETNEYEPIDLEKTYTYAATAYHIVDIGGGVSMYKDAEIIMNDGTLDVEVLEKYIAENLDGVVGKEYTEDESRITFTEGFVNDEKECLLESYTDLNTDAWYHKSAEYVLENGLMNGVSDNAFGPDEGTSRAMVVTVLWRMEGSPVVNYAMNFADVEAESWYAEAVRWAASQGIISGYSDTEFAPYDLVTREQLASIMWRYAKSENVDVAIGESTNILSYDDVFEVSEYAIPAFQWTCGTGIMSGNSQSTLEPKSNASRIQLAAVIHRYCESNIE